MQVECYKKCVQTKCKSFRSSDAVHVHNNYKSCCVYRYYETSSANGNGVYEMFSDLLTTVVERKLVKPKPIIVGEKDGRVK
jgi:hypothetical protein